MNPPRKPLHLLIADAVALAADGQALPPPPALRRLQTLLAHLRPGETVHCEPFSPDTPFERALACALGLPGGPGQVPWAAYESGRVGQACAYIRPCHWQLGMDTIRLLPAAQLQLSEAESRTLMAVLQPFMQEDGIQLSYLRPDAWLARGAVFEGLSTRSAARVAGQALKRESTLSGRQPEQQARLQRYQTEWQMLLHNHPINDAREGSGRPHVNALWVDGAGSLPAVIPPQAEVVAERRLQRAGSDPDARRLGWKAIALDSGARLAEAYFAGTPVTLTLCGPNSARQFIPGRGPGARLAALFRRPQMADYCHEL